MAQGKACVYCGDAPVNHRLVWIDTGINILLSALFRPRTASRFFDIDRSPVARALTHFLIHLAVLLGVIGFSVDDATVKTERTRSIWNEAKRRGIPIQTIRALWKRTDDLRALLPRSPGSTQLRWHYFESIPVPPWIQTSAGAWVDDKDTFKARFLAANLPVAQGGDARTFQNALKIFKAIGAPVIVKPREGSRARHTTVRIHDEHELHTAFLRAKQLCPYVMVEAFVSGTLYRATCVNNKLIGVIAFVKPMVVADGVMTVAQLLSHHNAHKRFPTLTDVKDDAWFRDAIAHQGYTLESVPPRGTQVLVSEHSERPNGGYFIDVTDRIPRDTVSVIERAAEVSEQPVIGFDIISENLPDASQPFTFIEGNSLPYIEIHDIPYEGTPRSVAAAVWDMWGVPSVR